MSNTTPDPGKPSDGTTPEAVPSDTTADPQATPEATSDEFDPDAFRDSRPEETASNDAAPGDTAVLDTPVDQSPVSDAGAESSSATAHHHTPEVADHAYAEQADTHVLSSSEPTVLTQADLHADQVRAEESEHAGDTAVAPVYTDSTAPVAPTPANYDRVEPAPVRQPVYVQAPSEPKAKGNRGFGILVSLLATVVFAAIYAVVLALLLVANNGSVDVVNDVVVKAPFWIPVIFFFVGMVLVVAVVNRGGWWAYVLGGFVVAAIVYGSYLGGVLIEQASRITPSEVAGVVQNALFSPAAVVAFVIGREVPIWFGAWIAARGRKVKERNVEARNEYERILDQGPVVS
ncbi:hypothetical protein IWX78_001948 [Mycetocola sp. CAN_C7]|uniref:hypothetical protein n=1 Tax=Mycetocola sp. CAN_C7 TaxID=2787724 RepID=UPI0018C95D52